ncbi:MAG TPA: hypothetical protein VGY77_10920 [Gemmataceae bacterium]|jgi:hypothetical protein|nr:hypothetical protein [Gemmataceae bacterium]
MARIFKGNFKNRCQLILVLGGAILPGCSEQPHAPALHDDPVYTNDRDGLRFLVPEGWSHQGGANLPGGKLSKEHSLVRFVRKGGDKKALFEITVASLGDSADLAAHAAGPSFSAKEWRQSSKGEKVETQGLSGTRFTFTGRIGKEEMIKEVVAFRKGDRVYFFNGLFFPGDSQARNQIRQAIASTIWKN